MKLLIIFFVSLLVGASLSFVYISLSVKPVKKSTVTPISSSAFSIDEAPSDALLGDIISLAGSTYWQSRTATEPARLIHPRKVQQGENLLTKEAGQLTADFDGIETIQLFPSTEVDLIQTLPANIVVAQITGSVAYSKKNNTPFSVKALSLLINQEQAGEVTIFVDKVTETVRVKVTAGQVKTAFADDQNMSNIMLITAGQTFVFDDAAHTGELL